MYASRVMNIFRTHVILRRNVLDIQKNDFFVMCFWRNTLKQYARSGDIRTIAKMLVKCVFFFSAHLSSFCPEKEDTNFNNKVSC